MNWFDGPDMGALYEALRKLVRIARGRGGWAAESLGVADEAARKRDWPKAFTHLMLAAREAGYDEGCGVTEAELEKHTKKKYGSWWDYYGNSSRWEEDVVGGKLNE